MKIQSWNFLGLEDPWKIRSLHKIVKKKAPEICFLMETRLDIEGINQRCSELPPRIVFSSKDRVWAANLLYVGRKILVWMSLNS